MELSGRIKYIGDTEVFGTQGFRKRELVLTTEEQYPQHILIEFTQDKCDLLDKHIEGEAVKIGINIRGREWVNPQGQTKYFNSIQAWRIEEKGGVNNTPVYQAEVVQPQTNYREEEHDLPF